MPCIAAHHKIQDKRSHFCSLIGLTKIILANLKSNDKFIPVSVAQISSEKSIIAFIHLLHFYNSDARNQLFVMPQRAAMLLPGLWPPIKAYVYLVFDTFLLGPAKH